MRTSAIHPIADGTSSRLASSMWPALATSAVLLLLAGGRAIWRRLFPLRDTDWEDGDVVCVAVVPLGQPVDWGPGQFQPNAAWVPEGTFMNIIAAAEQLSVPILPKLDIFVQSRLSSHDCDRILAKWPALERDMASGPGAHWVREIGQLLRRCSDGYGETEMFVEGP